jgi:hypothetical protein
LDDCEPNTMRRRLFWSLLGIGLLPRVTATRADSSDVTLLTADLEISGDWGGSATADVAVVINAMRSACLAGVALLSEHQPETLRVEDRSGNSPSVWLHTERPTIAWVTVVVGSRDWCNLAYQFGHELGHVLSNSWELDSQPRNPCQWVEEAMVEAFSLRGLGRMADDWERAPPFPGDNAYANSIRAYRETIVADYRTAAQDQGVGAGFAAWFKAHQAFLDEHGGIDDAKGAVSTMLGLLESDTAAIADLGALNRWPERSGVPLPHYLDLWQSSCAELSTPGRLPMRVRNILAGQ